MAESGQRMGWLPPTVARYLVLLSRPSWSVKLTVLDGKENQ